MAGKLDPTTPSEWQDYYAVAEKRRRRAGWRRADELRHPVKRRQRMDPGRLLAIVMGVAAVAVALSLAIPA